MFRSVLWNFTGTSAGLVISATTTIILARILGPDDYGLMGMVLLFIYVAQSFMQFGLGAALIQKELVSENAYYSVFLLNIGMGALLSCVLFFSADRIASFYGHHELLELVYWTAPIYFINSLSIVQSVRATKQMRFKTIGIVTTLAALCGGGVGISAAFYGFGTKALAFQHLTVAVVTTIAFWTISDWKVNGRFELQELKHLWGFGSKVFVGNLVGNILDRLDLMIIGKYISSTVLGYYTQAVALNRYTIENVSSSIAGVFFPAIGNIQNDKKEVEKLYEKTFKVTLFCCLFISGLLFLLSEPLVVFMLGTKWQRSAEFFQILVINGYGWGIGLVMVQLINGLDYAGKNLKLMLLKRLVMILSLFVVYQYGVEAMLYSFIVQIGIGIMLNIFFIRSIIEVGFKQHFGWFIGPILIACIGVFIVQGLKLFISTTVFFPPIQAFLFIIVYLAGNWCCNREIILLLLGKLRLLHN